MKKTFFLIAAGLVFAAVACGGGGSGDQDTDAAANLEDASAGAPAGGGGGSGGVTVDAGAGGSGDAGVAGAGGHDGGAPGDMDAGAMVDTRGDARGPGGAGGSPALSGFAHEATVCLENDWCWMSPTPQGFTLYGTHAFAADDLWAVGSRGTVLHYDGTGWARVPVPVAISFTAVWGTGNDNLYAAGTVGQLGREGALLHFDGKTWRTVDTGTNGPLYGIWGTGPNDVWVVGGDSTGIVSHFNGNVWTPHTGVPLRSLRGIWSHAPGVAHVVGSAGIMRWDGQTWTKVQDGSFGDIDGSGPDNIWAAGRNAAVHWDGQRWRRHSRSDIADPAVVVRGPDDVWIGSYAFQHWDGESLKALDGDVLSGRMPERGPAAMRGSWGPQARCIVFATVFGGPCTAV